jgi:hypothetical protein
MVSHLRVYIQYAALLSTSLRESTVLSMTEGGLTDGEIGVSSDA